MYYQICKVNYEVGSVDGFYNNTITRGGLLSVCVCEMRISAASAHNFYVSSHLRIVGGSTEKTKLDRERRHGPGYRGLFSNFE